MTGNSVHIPELRQQMMRKTMEPRYWLMKSEPDVFSLNDLKSKKTTWWDGVRNYTARNFMMKEMRIGDLVLFYHSNAKPSAVVGLAEVTQLAQPDETQFDKKSDYYDAKSTREKPRWYCVEVGYKSGLPRPVSLEEIKSTAKLKGMALLKYSRLSVQPVLAAEFKTICDLAEKSPKKI